MTQGSDIVVLGAGVAGCATAYYLARDGFKVTVIERESIGSCASGNALGLLNPLTGHGIPGPISPLTETAFKMHKELWPALEEESGVDFQARLMPQLEVCLTEDDVREQREEFNRWVKADGFSARWLEPDEVVRLEPRLTPECLGGIMLEDVGMLDSYRYTLALAQAAEHYGAMFITAEAVGLKATGNRVTGVVLGSGEIDCDALVVALGPWSGALSDWLGLDIPVEPLKGQILYIEGIDPPLEYYVHGPCSFVHKADGMVWVAATEEHTGFDNSTTIEARHYLMERAVKLMPCLRELKLLNQTACLRPITADADPILGQPEGWDGVYLATGAEKKGILISPVMGRATADLIIKGETALPIEQFTLERFTSAASRLPS